MRQDCWSSLPASLKQRIREPSKESRASTQYSRVSSQDTSRSECPSRSQRESYDSSQPVAEEEPDSVGLDGVAVGGQDVNTIIPGEETSTVLKIVERVVYGEARKRREKESDHSTASSISLPSSRYDATLREAQQSSELPALLRVTDSFIPVDVVKDARAEAGLILAAQRAAAHTAASEQSPAERGRWDTAIFLRREGEVKAGNKALVAVMDAMLGLQEDLDAAGYDVRGQPSFQLACHAANTGGFRRHRDRSFHSPCREVTAICYLTSAWCRRDAGELRIFEEDGVGVASIEPIGGRLVLLDSGLEHEVLPTYADRSVPDNTIAMTSRHHLNPKGNSESLKSDFVNASKPPRGMDASAQETLLPLPKSLMRRYALTVWFSRSQSTKEHSMAASLPTPLQGSEPLQWPPTASDDPAKAELQSGSPTQPQDGSSCPGVSQQVCKAERLRRGDPVVRGLVKSGASGRDISKEVGTAPGRDAAMSIEAADGSNALLRSAPVTGQPHSAGLHLIHSLMQPSPGHRACSTPHSTLARKSGNTRLEPHSSTAAKAGSPLLSWSSTSAAPEAHQQSAETSPSREDASKQPEGPEAAEQLLFSRQEQSVEARSRDTKREGSPDEAGPGACGGGATSDDVEPERCSRPASESSELVFISVAAYRDPEAKWTLQDLFAKARHPERLRVGVVWQIDAIQDQDFVRMAGDERWLKHVREVRIDWREATGPSKARALAQALWAGEEYVLQIDSHMRFAQNWDDRLLAWLHHAERSSRRGRAVLSCYPPPYEGEGRSAALPVDERGAALCADRFDCDGMLRLTGRRLREVHAVPLPGRFWAAGFSFSRKELLLEVPYDDDLPFLFFGEEAGMLVRMWTRGFDPWIPPQAVAFHLWSRAYRRTLQKDIPTNTEAKKSSQQKVRSLFEVQPHLEATEQRGEASWQPATPESSPALWGSCRGSHQIEKPRSRSAAQEPSAFGLGRERSLAAFSDFCGVDFSSRCISSAAKSGGLDPSCFA